MITLKQIEKEFKTLGEDTFRGNEHQCPDCGRGDIGDSPIKVKHTWIYKKAKDLFDKALSQREAEVREEIRHKIITLPHTRKDGVWWLRVDSILDFLSQLKNQGDNK